MKKIFLIFLTVGVSIISSAESNDPTNDMLQLFGGKCLTSGPNAQTAQNQANNLVGVVESLRANTKCNGISAALTNFQNATEEFNAYKKNAAVAELEGSVSDIELAIASEKKGGNDATYLASLNVELARSRIDLISKKRSQDYKSSAGKNDAIKNVDAYVKALLTQLSTAKECPERQNVSGQLAGHIMALSSNIVAGPTASFLLFGSSILESALNYFRNSGLSEAIKTVALAKRSEAVGCSLENIAHTYCQARDVSNLVDAQTEANVCVDCLTNKGLKILSKDLSAFIEWANRLSSGSAAHTNGQAMEKKEAIRLDAKFRLIRTDLLTKLATNERTYNETPPAEQKKALTVAADDIAKFIANNIAQMDCSTGSCAEAPGIFSQDFTTDPKCGAHAYLFTNGQQDSCKKTTESESCLACVTRMGFAPQPFDKMQKTVNDLLIGSKARIDKEVSRSIETDHLLVLAKLNSPVGVGNKTAKEFLENTVAYFDDRLKDPKSILKQNPPLLQAITKSKADILEALKTLSTGTNFNESDLAKISNLIIPANDIFHIGNNLNELVQQEFAEKAKQSNAKPDEMKWLIEYSINETMDQLMAIYGNADNISSQSDLTKSMTIATLNSMGKLFSSTMSERITQLQGEKTPRLSALYCIRTALIPDLAKNEELKNSCKGQVYTSKEPGAGAISMNYDTIVAEADDNKRICSIYDFTRKVSLVRKGRARK